MRCQQILAAGHTRDFELAPDCVDRLAAGLCADYSPNEAGKKTLVGVKQ